MIRTITLNPSIDTTWYVQNFDVDNVNRVIQERKDPGGKGINITRFITILGGSSEAYGFVGGNTGSAMYDLLQKESVQCDFIEISGETRINVSIVDKENNKTIKINQKGPELLKEEIGSFKEKLLEKTKCNDYTVFCGSLPLGIDELECIEILKEVRKKGTKLIVDTSGRMLKEAIKIQPYLIKPNKEEVEELLQVSFETINDIIKVAFEFNKQGIEYVIISMGKDGAVGTHNGKAYHVCSDEIDTKTVVGTGDAMLAGIVLSLKQNTSFKNAMIYGAEVGTAMAMTEGTCLPSMELIKEVKKIIHCREICCS